MNFVALIYFCASFKNNSMNILILGSGGREHTFAWKIAQSPLCNNLFVAPGNSGTATIATNVNIGVTDFEAIKKLVLNEKIDMVVVGPEDPLVEGVHDYFLNDDAIKHVKVIGPQKEAATLEGSKEFAKEFLYRHNIPTAAYESFTKDTVEKGFNKCADGRLTRRAETASCFSLEPVGVGTSIFINRLKGFFTVSECWPTRRYESTFQDTYLPFEDIV